MKSILKKDRILVFVALLGLLASLAPLAARTKAEQSNRYYDYILDYSSLRYMASQSTQSEGEWLDRFASLGIRQGHGRGSDRARSEREAPVSPSTP